MARYVVDASVAAKWLLVEEYSLNAESLRGGGHALLGPDLLLVELANVVRSWCRGGVLTRPTATRLVSLLGQFDIDIRASGDLLPAALEIALSHNRSVYDALYLSLALREGCQFVTADRRLYESVAPHFPGTVSWVGDLPATESI